MRRKGSTKTGEPRELSIPLRISKQELELLTKLCDKRKKVGSRRWSRTDVIIDALRFADGQIVF